MANDKNIALLISELLYNNDCVIVPGFGGFVTVYKPATILPKQNVMIPPSREVGFNKKLINNDGLMANEIATQNGLNFEQAMRKIEERVAIYNSELNEVKRLEIPGVGVLYIDKDGNYRFMPDENRNFLKNSFGLSKIYLDEVKAKKEPKLLSKKKTPIVPLVAVKPQEEESTEENNKFAWGKIAAVIAIPLFLVGAFWVSAKYNSSDTDFASLNPFKSDSVITTEYSESTRDYTWEKESVTPKENAIETLAKNNPDLTTIRYSFEEEKISEDGVEIQLRDNDDIKSSDEHISTSAAEENVVVTEEENSSNEFARSNHNFFVVAGAFGEKANANKLVNKLAKKGYSAYIFDKKKNLYYVCFDGFATKDDALNQIASIREITPSAWIRSK